MAQTAPPPDQVKRRPWWLSWWSLASLTLLALIGTVAGWRMHRISQLNRRVRAAVDELDRTDPGWRLDQIEANRAEVPEKENGARWVVAAVKLLPSGWPPSEFYELFPSDKLDPPEQLDAKRYARLRKELDAVRPAVAKARELTDRPRGRHRITYATNPVNTLLKDQQDVRTVAALLRYDALRRAQDGDPGGALRSCRAALNAGRSIGDEPLSISQLIRIACGTVACSTAERVLAQGEPPPDELAALQKALEQEALHPGLLIALRGERATSNALFEGVESGAISPADLEGMGRPASWQDRLLGWQFRDYFRAEHAEMLPLLTRRIEIAHLPLHEQAEAEYRLAREADKDARRHLLTALLLPALDRVAQAFRRYQAQLRCLAACLAAERFRRDHGRWPDSLRQLTRKYLRAVPSDPFDGKPLRYKRLEDGVIVYSVGPDATDNGGKLDRARPDAEGTDLGYRLWDVQHRRRPARARPEPPPAEGAR
jgi:hypothetical protein